LNQFRASLLVAQDILAPAPVADPEAVVAEHLVRYGRPVDTVAAPKAVVFARVPPGGAGLVLDVPVRPVDLRDELPAENTHGLSCLAQALDGGPFASGLALPKVVGDLLEGNPTHAGVAVDVVDQPLEHEEVLWSTRDVRVDG
jgi:hypothetical protein